MLSSAIALVTGTTLGTIGAATLAACATATLTALAMIIHDDLRPKGRHHRP